LCLNQEKTITQQVRIARVLSNGRFVIEGPDEYIRLADASELTVTIRVPVKEVIDEPQLIEPD